jgi:hypothetical protein
MENLKNYLVVGIISFVLGGAVIKYYWPTPVNVDNKQTVETGDTKNNIITVTTEKVKADGTKEITTTTTDKSEKKESMKSTETKTTIAKADLFFGGGYVKSLNSQEKDDYQVVVGKRLMGPVLGFVTYQFKGVVTANVVIEF